MNFREPASPNAPAASPLRPTIGLSAIIPVFNEAGTIEEIVHRLEQVPVIRQMLEQIEVRSSELTHKKSPVVMPLSAFLAIGTIGKSDTSPRLSAICRLGRGNGLSGVHDAARSSPLTTVSVGIARSAIEASDR